MPIISSFRHGLLPACYLALCIPIGALAQDSPDADAAEVGAYVLTEAAIAKFRKAQQNLAQLEEVMAANCDDDGGNADTLDAMEAKIRSVPGAAAAVEAAGLPVREYVVFVFSMVQTGFASWGLAQPGGSLPPGVSMANVEFYRAHEPELTEASSLTSSDACEEDEYDGYEEGEYEEDGYDE